ncbi:MAG: hypothetical protein QXJ28_02230 [Candidatus Pacearchaeota archaeon]
MKALIFDAGSLISLSMNSMLEELRSLRKAFNGVFLITEDIEHEIVERPIKVPKYKLNAMNLKLLINERIIDFPDSLNINRKVVSTETSRVLEITNSIFNFQNRKIKIIDKGEASCLALSMILNKKGIENLVVIDERTTRMLYEKPENLRKLLEKKLNSKIEANYKDLKLTGEFRFIRSSELIYIAYKKGLLDINNKDYLEAALQGLKFKGCSISEEEIKTIISIA